jgi:hypothetical protein
LLTLVLVLNIPVPLLVTLRSQLVLRKLNHPVAFFSLLPISFFGFSTGVLTPVRSGELVRAAMLKDRFGIPFVRGMSSVLYERGYSFYLLALSTLLFGLVSLWKGSPALAVPMAGLIAVLFFFPVVAYKWRHTLYKPVAALVPMPKRIVNSRIAVRIRDTVSEADNHLDLLFGDLTLGISFVTITLLYFLLTATQLWLLVSAFGESVGVHDAWLAWGLSAVVGLASFLPAGLGPADGALVLALSRLGISVEMGAAVALASRLLTTLPLGLAALGGYVYSTIWPRSSSFEAAAGQVRN